MGSFSEDAKNRIRKWSEKYAEEARQDALNFPYHYALYFKASWYPRSNVEYEEALSVQEEAPKWCERHFESGTWKYDPDLDGTYDFRFKTEEQLVLFKLRWHK